MSDYIYEGAVPPLTPGDAVFSDVAVSNNVRIYNNLSVDENIYLGGTLFCFSTLDATNITTGSMVTLGGVGIGEQLWVGSNETILGNLYVTSTTASTGTTTGSVVITGGLGVNGLTNLTNLVVSSETVGSLFVSNGAFTNLTVNSETAGALLVTGSETVQGTITGNTITDGVFKTSGGVFSSVTILGTSNVVAADFLNTTGAAVQVNNAPPTTGQVLTATGPTAATWQTGAGGVYSYAMFYGLTAGTGNGGATDYAATVAVKTSVGTGRVPFPRSGPASVGSATNFDGTSSFLLPSTGVYKVTFGVHTTEPGQLQLELNGADVSSTVAANMNPTSGGHPIGGSYIINSTAPNFLLSVINPDGNSTALTITPANGSETHANSQVLVIERIA